MGFIGVARGGSSGSVPGGYFVLLALDFSPAREEAHISPVLTHTFSIYP